MTSTDAEVIDLLRSVVLSSLKHTPVQLVMIRKYFGPKWLESSHTSRGRLAYELFLAIP